MSATPPLFLFLLLLALQQFPSSSGTEIRSFNSSSSPWRPSQSLTLISANRTFAAGFLNRSAVCHAGNGYIFAVWATADADKTAVWSLNCSQLVSAVDPSVAVDLAGTFRINGAPVAQSSPSTELRLEEDGRLVFGNWSSFGFPSDTILTGQPFTNYLLSKNGRYDFVNASGLRFQQSDKFWEIGDNGGPAPLKNLSSQGVLTKVNGNFFYAADVNEIHLRRITLDDDGNLRMYSLDLKSRKWKVVWLLIRETCKIHGFCSDNSVCYSNGTSGAAVCVCLPGFNRTTPGSCERMTELSPSPANKFLRLDFVGFPDSPKLDLSPKNFSECESLCLKNSSCLAFTYKYTGGRECTHRGGNLSNIFWSPSTETATYLRVAGSESAVSNFTGLFSVLNTVCSPRIRLAVPPKESRKTTRNLSIIGSVLAVELLIGVLSFWALLRRYSQYRDMARALEFELLPLGGPKQFSHSELKTATKDFSDEVGSGGFGVVYRGQLSDGRTIAVKRLKDNIPGSDQDFWAEASIIARVHHLNLVRLWGFCAEKGQRMLVYEFIPNGSLDKYIFSSKKNDEEGKTTLDWGIRYRIALGVARAIAYLHEECMDWVLHRDIKPENILLDGDLCPKISDFGLAKLLGEKERDWFSRSAGVRGTQGYMAPEWLLPKERITAKADVYSFGMVLLEMVTGARSNQLLRRSDGGAVPSPSYSSGEKTEFQSEDWYLPVYAYEKVCVEGKVEDMIDPTMTESYDSKAHMEMVERMLKTAIWCLQERPDMRPSMRKVAKMLDGSVEIMEPGKPTIFYLRDD